LALAQLERALVRAEPEGYARVFVDEGKPMARLLQQLDRKGVAANYITKILTAIETTDQRRPTAARASSGADRPLSALVEPLSERELEVLQLIAEGLTNLEIASRLFLSLHTIKVHASNIYGKLGVHSRTRAVARAQALGLLPHK
jgi:LuxR family maltose regulon positive regulatory protein